MQRLEFDEGQRAALLAGEITSAVRYWPPRRVVSQETNAEGTRLRTRQQRGPREVGEQLATNLERPSKSAPRGGHRAPPQYLMLRLTERRDLAYRDLSDALAQACGFPDREALTGWLDATHGIVPPSATLAVLEFEVVK